MRSAILGLAGLAALAFLASPASAHESIAGTAQRAALSPAARDAAAVVDAFHAALRRGDTRAAATLLTDDALVFEAGGAERKAEYAAHHLPADAEFSKAVATVVTRRTGHAAGAFAWIATEGRATGTYKGKAVDSLMTETMILRRVGQGWRIVHIHWSSAAKRQPNSTD